MFLYTKCLSSNKEFTDIALIHFKGLNPIKKDGISFYKNSVCGQVEINALKNGKHALFFKDLMANNYYHLERILTGNPNVLQSEVKRIEKGIKDGSYSKIIEKKGGKIKLTSFGLKIKEVFDYDNFIKKAKSAWDAYSLTDSLGINVCAYCNRNYTFTLSDKKEVRPELDHFLPKSRYPYLALSFYNLIPSCHICNSNLKHIKEFNFKNNLHPYKASFDKTVRFSVVLRKNPKVNPNKVKRKFGLTFYYGDLDSFDIELKPVNGASKAEVKRALKNSETFKIEELYNRHKDMVIEMVQNTILYDDSYVNSLFKKFGGSLFRSKEDVLRFITKNYITEEELPRRPFSKLSKDIHKEFGLNY